MLDPTTAPQFKRLAALCVARYEHIRDVPEQVTDENAASGSKLPGMLRLPVQESISPSN